MTETRPENHWTKRLTRQWNEGVQAAQAKIVGKTSPIEDDPLTPQRTELQEYSQFCLAFQGDVKQMQLLSEAVQGKQARALQLQDVLGNSTTGKTGELEAQIPVYVDSWATMLKHTELIQGRLEEMVFEIRNVISNIQDVQKKLEHRDKSHKKLTEERKKLDKARDNPNPQAWEKQQQKVSKADEEFQTESFEVSEDITGTLARRAKFLNEFMNSFFDLQRDLFAKLANCLQPPTHETLEI